jgi:predicted transposase/invertase (TIGR01784 family)
MMLLFAKYLAGRHSANRKNCIEIVKKMLKRGTPIEIIAEDTGLTHEQIEALRAE